MKTSFGIYYAQNILGEMMVLLATLLKMMESDYRISEGAVKLIKSYNK